MDVSIIICTRDRVSDLRQTLKAVASLCVPGGVSAELLVVDNASTDGTAELVRACRLPNMPVRYVHEPRRGKGYAYNTGMAAAHGEVFLFTDDDVRPPENWIEGMCGPILRGEGDAVAGGVRLAPHLERDWMGSLHQGWLASTNWIVADDPGGMVGANMAFGRHVLERVPGFDNELGPGALGFFDESLFAAQLREAGYRLAAALDVSVEHHFDESRLLRSNFVSTAKKFGMSTGYLAHHWYHQEFRLPRLSLLKRRLLLTRNRFRHRKQCLAQEGMPIWEMRLIEGIYFYKQYLVERKRPRNYEKHGLVKGTYS